jgi:hypothetical protein
MDLLLGCYPGLGEKTLAEKFSVKEIVQSISKARNLFLSCAHNTRQSLFAKVT